MSCLENNMTALKPQFPQLIRILEETEIERYELFPTKSGDVTVRADGVFIHSRHYPEKEAEKLIDREIDDSIDFCFFYGFGLGYHIEAFHRKYPDTLFAVIEPDKKLFLQALSCRDFSALFQSGMMNLLLGTEPEAVTVLLDQIKTTRIQSCLLRPLYLSNKEYYDQLDKQVRDYIAKKEINANTHHRFNRLWISNISRNAPLLSRAAGIYNLHGRFTGKAALLVAAGPGLSRILPVLEQLREHLLIVCVDTALKACLTVGVEPDFTVLTDPQYWNTRHIDRCRLKKSVLVSDVSTYPTVFRQTEGPLFFCSTPFPLGQYLESRTEKKGKLQSGGSVATAAWDLMRIMGCDPIYCAGLDLAFPGRQTHCKGSTFEERVHNFCDRYHTGENAGWQALHSGNPYAIEDYEGTTLLTDQRMKVYISWFERQMAEHPEVRSYNLSGKGARLKGMPQEDLEALFRLPRERETLDAVLREISLIRPGFSTDKVSSAVRKLSLELEQLASLTAKGLSHTRQMKKTGIDNRLLDELGLIDKEILSMGGREIAGFFLLPLLEGLLAGSHKKKTPEEVLDQSEEFYTSLKDSLDFHLSELKLLKKDIFS